MTMPMQTPARAPRVRLGLFSRIVAGLLLALLCGLPTSAARAGYASLVMDASNGQVLHEANADLTRYPASLTKMMTLYLLFEAVQDGRLSLDQRIPVSRHAAAQPPTKLGLRPGQSITVENAVLALITKSANDMAAVVAEAVGGTEATFATLMTAKARQLGMYRTRFMNASGLPDPDQVTTARDMSILALALIHDFPQYYPYFGTERFYYGGAAHANHNRMLGSYPGVDGIKTGYTHASGFNLVASAQRDGRRLIGVVMGARSSGVRSLIMGSLLDQAFDGSEVITAYLPPDDAAAVAPAVARGAVAVRRPAPDDAIVESSSTSGDWAVQLGSFRSRAAADRAARDAVRAAPGVLQARDIRVTRAGSGKQARYVARVSDLDRGDADRACRLLERRRLGCWAVNPAGTAPVQLASAAAEAPAAVRTTRKKRTETARTRSGGRAVAASSGQRRSPVASNTRTASKAVASKSSSKRKSAVAGKASSSRSVASRTRTQPAAAAARAKPAKAVKGKDSRTKSLKVAGRGSPS